MSGIPHCFSRCFFWRKTRVRINEAVAAYRLSRSTIYKLIATGTLRTVKIGGRRLVPRDALEALFNEHAR